MESARHLSTQELVGIYERIKTIAVVGASADGSKTANAKPASRRMVRWQLRVARPGGVVGAPSHLVPGHHPRRSHNRVTTSEDGMIQPRSSTQVGLGSSER